MNPAFAYPGIPSRRLTAMAGTAARCVTADTARPKYRNLIDNNQ